MRRQQSNAGRPELVSLLRAAKQHPDDDAHRLVVADWLEENGGEPDQARAELIRLQLRLPSLPERSGELRQAKEREEELKKLYAPQWLGPIAKLNDGWRLERGMLAMDTAIGTLVGRKSDALSGCEELAWLERLTLRGGNEQSVSKALQSPLVEQASGLVLASQGLGPQFAAALAETESLAGLVSLDLNYNRVGSSGARALAASPHLSGLLSLDLWINRIGWQGGEALGQGQFHSLRSLNIGGNQLSARGMTALACSPILARVRTLLVWGNRIGADGLRALVHSPHTEQLRTLYLNENRLGSEGGGLLAGWKRAEQLTSLSIWGNDLGEKGCAALAEAPLDNLRALLLNDNKIGDVGAIALAGSPHLRRLRQLDLHTNGITDAGARALVESPYLENVHDLKLRDNPISDSLREAVRRRFVTRQD